MLPSSLTVLLPSQPQRVCCAEAHRHQQEVLHQLQAVVPEENLWQIHVSVWGRSRPCSCAARRAARGALGLGLGRPSGRLGRSRSHEGACADVSGCCVLGSGLFSKLAGVGGGCIFKVPDKTWIQFSGLMWDYKKREIQGVTLV